MAAHEPRDKTDRARAPGRAGDAQDGNRASSRDRTGDQPAGNPSVETDQLHALTSDEPAGAPSATRHMTVDAANLGDILPGANDEDQ